MTQLPLNNLEQLLERMGSVETPEILEHRYALRRALLNSPRFEQNRFRIVWTRLFTYTATFVAGGAVVAVMVVAVMTVELEERRPAAVATVAEVPAVQVEELVAENDPAPVEFASFSGQPELRHVLEFARPATDFAMTR